MSGEPEQERQIPEGRPIRGAAVGWIAWLAVAVFVTLGNFIWEFHYFGNPGPPFQRLIAVLLPAFLAALAAYLWIRRRGFWKREPACIGALLLAALLYYQFVATIVTVWVFIACCALGRWLRERLGLDCESPVGGIAISAAIGFGAVTVLLIPLGLAHGYYPAVFAALLGAASIGLWRQILALGRDFRSILQAWKQDASLRDPLAGVAVVFGAIAVAMTAIVAIAPSVAFDVLRMHLPAVIFYSSHHVLAPVPGLAYSYYPQGAELLMTLGYTLAGQPAAQMIAALFFGLTALVGLRLVREAGADRVAALAAIAGAVSIPFLHWSGSVAKNDLMLAFFELTALYEWLRWRTSGNFRWIQLGACLVAAGFGVKYVALYGAVPLAILFLYAAWKQQRPVRAVASLALLFFLLCGYWPIRAFVLTGNPVYPKSIQSSIKMSAIRAVAKPATAPHKDGRHHGRILKKIHFNGQALFESPLECPTGIYMLIAAPAWLLFRKRVANPAERACLFFAALYLLYWASTQLVLRYSIPGIFILQALTIARLAGFYRRTSAPIRASILCAGVYCLLFASLGAAIIDLNAPQLQILRGKVDGSGYLGEALATFNSLEFLRRNGGVGERVFSIDNCSDAYAPQQMAFTSYTAMQLQWPKPQAKLRAADYSWLVLPSGIAPATLDQFNLRDRFTERYRDASFVVFRKAH